MAPRGKLKRNLPKKGSTQKRLRRKVGGRLSPPSKARHNLPNKRGKTTQQTSPATPGIFLLQGERDRLRDILDECYRFLDNGITAQQLKREIKAKLFSSSSTPSGPIFLAALKALIRYLTDTNKDESRLSRVHIVANTIALEIQNELGSAEYGGINFNTVAEIKQAYWSAKAKHDDRKELRHQSYDVLRINDVPFAESVFAKLMQEHTGELGYIIQVVNVEWSEVGAALRSNRIDVALYNGTIKNQLLGVEHRFDSKLILPSKRLYRYSQYPVLASTLPGAENKISVPFNSDFEVVIEDNVKGGRIRLGPRESIDAKNGVIYCSSADEALANVVDGKTKYCIVGALQRYHALKQFGKSRVRDVSLLDQSLKTKKEESEADARFWVAADRRDDAKDIIAAMVAIWNKAVVREWNRIVYTIDPALKARQTEIIEFINAQQHKAFVERFDDLVQLISTHDGELDIVDPGIDDDAMNSL
jgi:hypothetical protein